MIGPALNRWRYSDLDYYAYSTDGIHKIRHKTVVLSLREIERERVLFNAGQARVWA